MQKPRDTELEEVDSCTKLLDMEIDGKRRRRNSMPFLPSRYKTNNCSTTTKKDSNKRAVENQLGAPPLNRVLSPLLIFLNKTQSCKSSVTKPSDHPIKSISQSKKNDKSFDEDQSDDFYATWKRIQGSRMSLAEKS